MRYTFYGRGRREAKEYGRPTLRPELVSQIKVNLDSAGAGGYEMLASRVKNTDRRRSSIGMFQDKTWGGLLLGGDVDKSRPLGHAACANRSLPPLLYPQIGVQSRSQSRSRSRPHVLACVIVHGRAASHLTSRTNWVNCGRSSSFFMTFPLLLVTTMSSSALIDGEKEHR
jgi:hypothetical protein